VNLDEVSAKLIDEDLAELDRHEIEGAWRSLCAMMLWRTANLLTCKFTGNKDFAYQRSSALRWIDGRNVGTVSFDAACETLDLDAAFVREGLIRHADTAGLWAINKATPQHPSGGIPNESPAENSHPPRMVAGTKLHHRDLCGTAR
jgi:hypothetical protein